MNYKLFILGLLFLLFGPIGLKGQQCECTTCGVSIDPSTTFDAEFQVLGSTNNDLSNPGQGVCGVIVEFSHDFIWGVEMVLTSPGGQQVTLLGDQIANIGSTNLALWNVLFLPAGQAANPDPGFNVTWDNDQAWSIFGDYTGSYYPFNGDLEDFNTGTIDGTWTLTVDNNHPFNGGQLVNFTVLFCDDAGLNCFVCDADAGNLGHVSDTTVCLSDPFLLLDVESTYSDTPPDTTLYEYTFVISNQDTIIAYDTMPDLRNFPGGIYELCGMSYFIDDSLDIPDADGTLLLSQLRADLLAGTPGFCADLTLNCFTIEIIDYDTTFVLEELCFGDTLFYNGDEITTGGSFVYDFQSVNNCDSIVQIDLSYKAEIFTAIDTSICFADSFFIADTFFIADGLFDLHFNSFEGCDSTVQIDLTVLDEITEAETISICAGDTLFVETFSFFNTGLYDVTFTSASNCDSIVTYDLTVRDSIITEIIEVICNGDSLFIANDTVFQSGQIDFVLPSFQNCDSFVRLDLTVLPPNENFIVDNICGGDSVTVGDSVFYSSGNYVIPFVAFNQCDSIVNLDLTVQDSIFKTENRTICAGGQVNIGTNILDSTGVYTLRINTPFFCDTFLTVNLTVLDSIITPLQEVICFGEQFPVGNSNFNSTDIYTVVLPAFNGCDSFVILDLTVLEPIANIEMPLELSCTNNPIELNGTTSQALNPVYEWAHLSNGGGGVVEGIDSVIALINDGGTYELTLTDTLGGVSCSSTTTAAVSGDLIPPNGLAIGGEINCRDTSIELTGQSITPGVNYEWFGPMGFNSLIQNPTINQPGEYTLLITAPNNCVDTNSVTVELNQFYPNANAIVNDTLDCGMSSVELLGNSDSLLVTYSWTGPGTFTSMNQNALVSNPGEYILFVTGDNFCTSTDTLEVIQDEDVATLMLEGDTLDCLTNTVQLTASSTTVGLTYQWSGPGGFNDTIANPTTQTPGAYTVVGTAPNDCTVQESFTVRIDTISPDLTLLADTIDCLNTLAQLNVISASNIIQYNWTGLSLSNDTIPNPTTSQPGSYMLEATGENFCTASASIDVLVDTIAPIATIQFDDTLNCRNNLVFIQGQSSVINTDFSWTGPNGFTSTFQNVDASEGGEYILTVTGANNCYDTAFVLVVPDTLIPDFDIPILDTIDCQTNEVMVSVSSSVDENIYAWSGPNTFTSSDSSFLTGIAGPYTIEITAANGCTADTLIVVALDTINPVVSILLPDTLDCDQSSVELISQSVDSITGYQWVGPNGFNSNDARPLVNTAGIYSLIATALNECQSLVTTLVIADTLIPDAQITILDTLDCLNTNVTLFGSSTLTGVTYSWTGPDSFTSDDQEPSVTVPGFYTLTVNNPNGCNAMEMAEVLIDTISPDLTLTITDTITCTNSNVQINSITTTTNPSYLWMGPGINNSSDPNPIVNQEGEYFLTLANSSGCSITESIQAEIDTIRPDVSIIVNDSIDCERPAITLFGQSSFLNANYNWTGPGAFDFTQQNPLVSEGGLYELTAFLPNGCSNATQAFVVADTLLPSVTLAVDDSLNCSGNDVLISAITTDLGLDFEWTGPNAFTSLLQNPTVSNPGVYTLVASDINDCTVTAMMEVVIDTLPPDLLLTTLDTIDCLNNQATIISSSSFSDLEYNWMGPNGFTSMLANPSVSTSGEYTLSVIATNECVNSSSIDILSDTISPDISVLVQDTLDCETPFILVTSVSSSQNLNYAWLSNGGLIGMDSTLAITEGGAYTLQVQSENACLNEVDFTVESDTLRPDVMAEVFDTLDCQTNMVQLEGSSSNGSVSFSWTGPGMFLSNDQNPFVSVGGAYELTVTDLGGCSASTMLNVEVDSIGPDINPLVNDTLDCTINQVTIFSNSTTDDLDFSWEGPLSFSSVDSNIQVVNAGAYSLTVTDPSGCSTLASVNVVVDTISPDLNLIALDTLNCVLDSVAITAGGSSNNLMYQWTGPGLFSSTESNPFVELEGWYELMATASNTCSSIDSVFVFSNNDPPDLMVQGGVLDCSADSIQIFSSSTRPIDSISWQGPSMFNSALANPFVQQPGPYVITVIDANGCSATDVATVVPGADFPVANAGLADTLTCFDQSILLDASASSGNDSLTWLNESGMVLSNDLQFEIFVEGIYILEVASNQANCFSRDTVIIGSDQDQPISEIITIGPSMITCEDTVLNLDGNTSQPSGEINFSWFQDNTEFSNDLNVEITEAGVYQLIIENENNGCRDTSELEILANQNLPFINIASPDLLTCVDTTVELNAIGSSQGTGFQVSWTSIGSGNIVMGDTTYAPLVNQPGEYMLVVLNSENNCADSSLVTVLENTLPPIAEAGEEMLLDCTENEASLSAEGSTSGNDITFLWSGSGAIENEMSVNPTIFESGNYILQVTNSLNGCQAIDSVLVSSNGFNSESILLSAEMPSCFGENDGSISIDSISGISEPFLYSLEESPFSLLNDFQGLQAGNYELVIQDANGCEWDTTFLITNPEPIQLDLGEDQTINLGDSIELDPIISLQLDSFVWQANDYLSCDTCMGQFVNPMTTSAFNLFVFDENGCSVSDQIVITVIGDRLLYFPTAFSPNQDGENETFMIYGGAGIEEIDLLQIFDRWGNIVHEARNFQPNDPAGEWDGLFKGKKLDPAVFVYIARASFVDGKTEIFSGEVMLIK